MTEKKSSPINIRPMLKEFIESRKIPFKKRIGEFVAVPEIIMYYLSGNEEFVKDFTEYCQSQNKEVDLLKLLTRPQ